MSYEVLARKWRPQQFQEVVGQDHVVQTLERALVTGRVAHAYLFVGPRGTGKTTTARILAKALNCMNRGSSPNPCDRCDSCREIVAGNSLDVIEIDGASNNNVDQVRELRENVRYAPVRGPYKVYIIDEVHMLSTGAFNALLKTLEEPPAHAVFILATTDVHKVPATILSRCQRFDLKRIGLKGLVSQLRKIAEAEKWTISDDALLAIARGAEGGLRDAESALDQLISFRGTTIEETDVLDVFGLVSWTTLDDLSRNILTGDAPAVLRLVGELDEGGRDLQRLVGELLGYFRNILILLHAPDMAATFDLTEVQLDTLRQRAASADAEKLLRIVDILTEAANNVRFALSRRTLVEVAFIKASRAASVVSIDELIRQIRDFSAGGDVSAAPAVVYKDPTHEKSGQAKQDLQPIKNPEPSNIPVRSEAEEMAWLTQHWTNLIKKVGEMDARAAQGLHDAKPISLEQAHLTIGVDAEFAEEQKFMEKPIHRQAVERLLNHELGHAVSVRFVLLEETAAGLPSDHPVAEKTTEDPASSATLSDLENDPMVLKTLEIFSGDLIEVRI